MRPRIGMLLYANPDRFPPTANAAHLLAQEHDVTILCRDVDTPSLSWPDSVEILRLGDPSSTRERMSANWMAKIAEYRNYVRSIRDYVREKRPALLYAYEPHGYVAALRARGNAPIPVLYHRHELEALDQLTLRSFQTWIYRTARRRSNEASFMVFPEAQRAALYAREVPSAPEACIVPNFPRLQMFPPFNLDRDELLRRWERRELVYRGALGAANGNLEHVRCLRVARSHPVLRFLGDGPEEFLVELKTLIDVEAVAERVSLDGFVPYERANALTRQASVGLALYQTNDANLTYSVTATNKLYEYAACGLPVIVPNTAAYRDYLKDETWVLYADPAAPASIADAIDQVFSDRDRYAAMCLAARDAFETRYNYEAVFQPVLEKILALSGAPSS